MSERLSVRARFERFPATVKGAFILRGEDRDPHQVIFRQARVVAIGEGEPRTVPMAEATLDVAPKRDLFVPFEMPVSDLDPGWYDLECDLEVDGTTETHSGGKRFSVPWPRATVRRGTVRIDRTVALGKGTAVRLEQLDLGGDSIRLQGTVEPVRPVTVRLVADGHSRLEVLEHELDEASGRLRVTAYPLLRVHGSLRIEIRGRGRGDEGSLDLPLPPP